MNFELIVQLTTLAAIIAAGPAVIILLSLGRGNL